MPNDVKRVVKVPRVVCSERVKVQDNLSLTYTVYILKQLKCILYIFEYYNVKLILFIIKMTLISNFS